MRSIRYQEIADELRAARARRTARDGVAERVGTVGRVRRQPGDGASCARAGPRRGVDRRPPGLRMVRRHRAGAAATRAAADDRVATRDVGARRRAARGRVRLRGAAGARAPTSSASTACCASSASTSPTASRSPSSRCGARPSSVSTCRWPTSSSDRSTSCSTIELRGATQTIGADLAEPGDAELLAVPVGSPMLQMPARHHRHGRATGVDERAPVPSPSNRVRRRPAQRPALGDPDRAAARRRSVISCLRRSVVLHRRRVAAAAAVEHCSR